MEIGEPMGRSSLSPGPVCGVGGVQFHRSRAGNTQAQKYENMKLIFLEPPRRGSLRPGLGFPPTFSLAKVMSTFLLSRGQPREGFYLHALRGFKTPCGQTFPSQAKYGNLGPDQAVQQLSCLSSLTGQILAKTHHDLTAFSK